MKKRCLLGMGCVIVAWFTLVTTQRAAGMADSGPDEKGVFKNLEFRNLGPAVGGGRVAAVAGIPGNPLVYYVGAAGGGVFKSTDGGVSWTAIFEHEATSSIGALALAPSNPDFIWVGTGESKIRNDVIDGRGVYFSPDGGHSWKFMGLADVGQIADIAIDPIDPNVVFVGALGHAWGPNADRGVFRTTDGGKTWKKVLYVDDSTGVANLVMQPGNSKVLYAAMWQARRYPWTLVDGGPSSGIYRTTDGGDTWKKLTEGLPEGPLGRIGIAVAPSNPSHLCALIAARQGMLWQSTDMGDHWTIVNNSHALDVRPFYFSRLLVSPVDENKVYFSSFSLMESDDGGKTVHVAERGVHSDHHALWIDPKNPDRMIQGNDGGAYLTTDGGKNWRSLHDIPIEQFYMVSFSSETPYTLCGGLQDNNAWCGLSSNPGGGRVAGPGWYTVAGGDGEYAVIAPSDPNIVYVDSQNGSITRLDKRVHYSHFIRPYLDSVEEMKPSDLKYRFNWTSPIAVSENDANEVYLGGNVLFKSTDGGRHWTPISPDLTRDDKSKEVVAGGPVQHDISGAETYDTLLCITIASADPKVIWTGSDDGLVHVTRDGGKRWTNVTDHVPGAPAWAMVYQVGVSPFDAGTAYVAFDAHKLDDRRVYVYKTSDYGQTWQRITNGLPPDVAARVVREDPNQRGLLVLGTDTGLYFSQDAGEHWQPLKSNFPTVPVYDLRFVKSTRDLVVATHGRGLFVFDDIRPLEEISASIQAADFHVFTPGTGTEMHRWAGVPGGFGGGGGFGVSGFSAPNAPQGVVIDYFLKTEIKGGAGQRRGGPPADAAGQGAEASAQGASQAGAGQVPPGGQPQPSGEAETPSGPPGPEARGPVKIVVTDAQGATVATRYGLGKAGINRFVWDMRYDPAKRPKSEGPPPPEEMGGGGFFGRLGPLALPGEYHITLTAAGKTQQATAMVQPDPTLKIDLAEQRAQLKAALEVRNEVNALVDMLDRLDDMDRVIAGFRSDINGGDDAGLKRKYAALLRQGEELDKKLKDLKSSVYNTEMQHGPGGGEDSIHYLSRFYNKLTALEGHIAGPYGEAPNELVQSKMEEMDKELAQHLAHFNTLLRTEVASYNRQAYDLGAPTVFAGTPISARGVLGR